MNDGKDPTKPAAAGTNAESGGHDGASSSTATTTSSSSEDGDLSRRLYAIDFRVHVSMRYHQARRAWWTGLNRISSIAAALAGSAAVISVSGANTSPYWAYVAAASGAFAALNAALGFTERAREHAALYDKFSGVAARMALEAVPDDAVIRRYSSEVLLLEASEPPSIHALNVVCHNQECEARGLSREHRCKVYLLNRLLKSLFTCIDHFPSLPTEEPTPWWRRRFARKT